MKKTNVSKLSFKKQTLTHLEATQVKGGTIYVLVTVGCPVLYSLGCATDFTRTLATDFTRPRP
jgi:hypothetical protein